MQNLLRVQIVVLIELDTDSEAIHKTIELSIDQLTN